MTSPEQLAGDRYGDWDAAYVPEGASYRLEGTGDGPADVIVGAAPSYLDAG